MKHYSAMEKFFLHLQEKWPIHSQAAMNHWISTFTLLLAIALRPSSALAAHSDFELQITPPGTVIYKLEEQLGTENWALFLSVQNHSKKNLSIDTLAYSTSALGKTLAKTVNSYSGLVVPPGQTHKMPLQMFREQRDKNADEMTVEVQGNGATIKQQIKLARYGQKLKLQLPLKGVWVVGSAHDYGISHRRWDNRAHFAWDFLKVDAEGRTTSGDVNKPQSHYAFGESVFAPADGVVLKVQDGFPDHQVGTEAADANAVFIDFGGDLVGYLAHLKKGSITVREGERLKAGQKIAEVGNSGQSTLPHLHFHVQKIDLRTPDFLKKGTPIPVSFSDYETINAEGTWGHVILGRPNRGDFLKAR